MKVTDEEIRFFFFIRERAIWRQNEMVKYHNLEASKLTINKWRKKVRRKEKEKFGFF
jgi:hypothetical protein